MISSNKTDLQQYNIHKMLSLDNTKFRTITIYSKAQINSLYIEFKNKLNQLYAEEHSPQTATTTLISNSSPVESLLLLLKLLCHLWEVPHLLHELNYFGEIQLLASLEILFSKASHWNHDASRKPYRQTVQKWVAVLMKRILHCVKIQHGDKEQKSYQIKPAIQSIQFNPQQQYSQNNSNSYKGEPIVKFYAEYLNRISKSKNLDSMYVAITFLRIFLINQLQNKRNQFKFIQRVPMGIKQKQVQKQKQLSSTPSAQTIIKPQWESLNFSLLNLCPQLQSLKNQQICVSICYFLCSQHQQFVHECIGKGLLSFLCESLKNKNITQWYGRKILNFIKLLVIGGKNYDKNIHNMGNCDIVGCIAEFTLRYDNQQILQQSRRIISHLHPPSPASCSKISIQVSSYNAYLTEKSTKNLQKLIKNSRILLLYSQDEFICQQLKSKSNYEHFCQCIKKQDNISILGQIFNIVAYGDFRVTSPDIKNNKDKLQIQYIVIYRVASILSNSNYKNQLLSNNKKMLISLIRMLKQLIQNSQSPQSIIEKIKGENVTKKFGKYSDFSSFRYERQLLSLIRLLNIGVKLKSKGLNNQWDQKQSKQTMDMLKGVLNHINNTVNNTINIKMARPKIQEELQQLQLILELLSRGEAKNLKPQIISAIFKKVRSEKSQSAEQSPTSSQPMLKISILDQSQQQRQRILMSKVSALAIKCLKIVQQDEQKIQYQIKQQNIQKLIQIGKLIECNTLNNQSNSKSGDLQKVAIQYLIILDQHGKINGKFKDEINDLYCKYRDKYGQDSEILYSNKNIEEQENQIPLKKIQSLCQIIKKILSDSLQKQLSQMKDEAQIQKKLQMLQIQNENQFKIVMKFIQQYIGIIKKFKQKENGQNKSQKMSNKNLRILLKFLLKFLKMNIQQEDDLKKILQGFGDYFNQLLQKKQKGIENNSQLSQQQHTQIDDTNTNLIFQFYSNMLQYIITQYEIGNQHQSALLIKFKKPFDHSYSFFTKDSLQFTNDCLAIIQKQFEYAGSQTRKQQLWKYIYNAPQMITRETVYLLKNQGPEVGNKFWSFFCDAVSNNIEAENRLTINFLQLYSTCSLQQLQNFLKYTQPLYQKIVSLLHSSLNQFLSKPSELLGRKIQRLAKCLQNILKNQSIQIGDPEFIIRINNNVEQYLTTIPQMQNNKKINKICLKFIVSLVGTLRNLYRRRDGFYAAKQKVLQLRIQQQGQLKQKQNQKEGVEQQRANKLTQKGYGRVCHSICQYKKNKLNQIALQTFRILLLRDDKHQISKQTEILYKLYKQKLLATTTQQGQSHYESCERILESINKKKQKQFKREYMLYFYPNALSLELVKINFTDEELLNHLRNLLNPPSSYGIHFLYPHLRLVEAAQFSNIYLAIFVNSLPLFNQKQEDHYMDSYDQTNKFTIQQLQNRLIQCIWGPGCELKADFYKVLSMNQRGLKVGLKVKSIGIEGVSIVCQKFFEFTQEIPLCSEILHRNVVTSKEWSIVQDKKIPDLINEVFKKRHDQELYAICVANLIGSSSKLKQIQNNYKIQSQLLQNLKKFSSEHTSVHILASTLYAISGLLYLNDGNQKYFSTKNNLSIYLQITERNLGPEIIDCEYPYQTLLKRTQNTTGNMLLFQKCCNLLSNLVYKNISIVRQYLDIDVQKRIVVLASGFLYHYQHAKQFLRLIGNLCLSIQAVNSIIKTQFLNLWKNYLKQAEANRHIDIIKYSIDIIYNMLNYHQIEAKPIAYKILQNECLPIIVQHLNHNILNGQIVQSSLQSLQKACIIQPCRHQVAIPSLTFESPSKKNNDILASLQLIPKTQSKNLKIFLSYTRFIMILVRDVKVLNECLIQSEVFGALAMFLKLQQSGAEQQYINANQANQAQINTEILSMLISISQFVFQKGQMSKCVSSGYIDLLAQLIKTKQVKDITASTLIDFLTILHEKTLLSEQSYTKIFASLMSRLQHEFRQQISTKILSTLTKIRNHITITTNSASILQQFSIHFLTKSQLKLLTSPKYKKRVREFLCLLAYFIAFSRELKLVFGTESFKQILNTWIRINKAVEEEDGVLEACRIVMIAIQDKEGMLVNASTTSEKKQQYIKKLLQPTKCLLYRTDYSNKSAIIQLNESPTLQLMSYKAPNGQRKLKYTLPIGSTICIISFNDKQNAMYKQTLFAKGEGGLNLFQKQANPKCCAAVIGIVGVELSIRQFFVEFQSENVRNQWVDMLKVTVSYEIEMNRINKNL